MIMMMLMDVIKQDFLEASHFRVETMLPCPGKWSLRTSTG